MCEKRMRAPIAMRTSPAAQCAPRSQRCPRPFPPKYAAAEPDAVIPTVHAAAISIGACRIINIKQGRVGGLRVRGVELRQLSFGQLRLVTAEPEQAKQAEHQGGNTR